MKLDKRFHELMTFAASEATIALSELLKEPMSVEVMDVSIVKKGIKKDLAQMYPKREETILMTTSLVGVVEGLGTFILPKSSAYKLCDSLLKTETHELGEMEQSALLETGNIVIGCFLNALGYVSSLTNILHRKLQLTICEDGYIPDVNFGKDSDEVFIKTAFHMVHLDHQGKKNIIDFDGCCAFFFDTEEVLARI